MFSKQANRHEQSRCEGVRFNFFDILSRGGLWRAKIDAKSFVYMEFVSLMEQCVPKLMGHGKTLPCRRVRTVHTNDHTRAFAQKKSRKLVL